MTKKIRTHYTNLQVTENASIEAIKGAYKHLSHKFHPDKSPDDRKKCEKIMVMLNKAYKTLSNPELRKEHDEWIKAKRKQQENEKDDEADFKNKKENQYYNSDKSYTDNSNHKEQHSTNSKTSNNNNLISCRSCGSSISKFAELCPKCGDPQKQKKPEGFEKNQESKSKNVTAVLSIFLGGLGIHKFYLGQWQGVFYLFFSGTGIPSIIAFIEGLRFLFMNQEKWDEEYAKGEVLSWEGIFFSVLALVAIIGILATVAIPAYENYKKKAKGYQNSSISLEEEPSQGEHNRDMIKDGNISIKQQVNKNNSISLEEEPSQGEHDRDMIQDSNMSIEQQVVQSTNYPLSYTETGIEFIKIPSGCFQMGSNYNGYLEHSVCITKPYYLGKYEVTQGQWQAIMGSNPSKHKKGDNHPVENIDWNDVQNFIHEINSQTDQKYRLPTEAEWEYACRSGGKSQEYCGGNDPSIYGWYGEDWGRGHHPVGKKVPNDLGLYDMSGNVWEWVSDRYDHKYYQNSPINNPTGPSEGIFRVFRGGIWNSMSNDLRSSARGYGAYDHKSNNLGFRIVRDYY